MSITIHIKSGQNKWDVSIDPSQTILNLKEEIAKVSEIPSGNQRSIYSGKILKDDQTVESYNIKDDHAIHMVKSGGNASTSNAPTNANESSNSSTTAVPSNIASGQTGGFNPLADLTGARYAGYANLPSADMFGPDGGINNAPDQDEMLRMMENPIFQSQMNEMLSNPEMLDFMIQSNPQLQAMGPQARQMLQSPFFRQMSTNPAMIRQSMQFARMMNGQGGMPGADATDASAFPAPGGDDTETTTGSTENTSTNNRTNSNANANPNAAANPFAALMDPASNPFAAMMGNMNNQQGGAGVQQPAFDPTLLASLLGGQLPAPAQEDNRPPEERYEQQLRQSNDMGFFDFDRNVAALRRSGGSVQGALDALSNGDV